ncbi:cyclase family protein [Saccharopolyspora phatthalungensis]|uniref:Kynurenine formamidase n=1 Tax=Saccharopolyspora phatthalungensis TaxID=664693 RepID=A0A840PYZ0_9PSEU|nr:cyclase family protein [Saccharopolyspora phatthalungensis]MBB5153516.1 kynurenine formamidase [Saccharopolyspora phatthalungensis]
MRLLDVLADGDQQIIDLSQPLQEGMPASPTHPGFRLALAQRHGDVVRADGMTGSHELIVMGGHVGTHMDAFSHVATDGLMYGEVPVADAVEHGRYRVNGIDQVPPIVCRGVLFDIARLRGVARLEPGEPVTATDLTRTGLEPRPGDVALIRTGWPQLWDSRSAYVGGESGVPGLDPSGAKWLAARQVRAVGADTIALEQITPSGGLSQLPVHRILLREEGIYLIEVMNLEQLSATGATEFLFICAPLRIVGATGAPVRPLAVLASPC